MLKKYSQKINFLAVFLVLVSMQVGAIQILHPGVKINSRPITEEMYLLTRAELDSFNDLREDLKAARDIIALRDARERHYENAVASLTQNIIILSDKLTQVSQTLHGAATDKQALIQSNTKLKARQQRNNLFYSLLIGLGLGKAGGFKVDF